MDCHAIEKLIPLYIDEELDSQEYQSVKAHLAGCPICQKELQAFEKSWAMLDDLEGIEPEPGFVGRFWTRLSLEQSWHEQFWNRIRELLFNKRLMPALATICTIIIIGTFTLHNYLQIRGTDQVLANLSNDDFDMVQNIELAENFDLIQEIEFFEDFNIIMNLDALETL